MLILDDLATTIRGRVEQLRSMFKDRFMPYSYQELVRSALKEVRNSAASAASGGLANTGLSLRSYGTQLRTAIVYIDHIKDFLWVDFDRDNEFMGFVTGVRVHSMNELATLRALDKAAQPDTTGWFLVDIVSSYLKGSEVRIECNLKAPNSSDEYWHLAHAGSSRSGYTYYYNSASTHRDYENWNTVDFDEDRYHKYREGCYCQP